MKRWLPFFLSVLLVPVVSWAMTQSSVPTKFPIPWGNSAAAPYIRAIPQASQIGVQDCAASLTDGFPPQTFIPQSSGGCPPFGADFNGIIKQVTQWAQWQAAGAAPLYDSSFSSSIGGYPSGATLANATTPGCFWISQIDNNASNPDSGGANWTFNCPGGGIGTNSTGSANSQIVAATPTILRSGMRVTYIAGFTNTGPLKVNVNGTGLTDVYRTTQLGTSATVGGETVAGQQVVLTHDGTRWQCTSCAVAVVGEIKDYVGAAAPTGWQIIDGSCLSQTTFADLFSVIGVANFGSVSCSAGNFALPDGRGRVMAGIDNMGSGAASRLTSAGTGNSGCAGSTRGQGCGTQALQLAQNGLPNATLGIGTITATATFGTGTAPTGVITTASATTGSSSTIITMSGATASMNGNVTQTYTNTIPPLQTVTKIIKL